GNRDARPRGERRHQRSDGRELRPSGTAERHRALGRPAIERPFGGLLAIVYSAGRREETAERDHARRRAQRRMTMSAERTQFTPLSRLLHWLMAAMVLTMLCIGVAMVASLADYHTLVAIHRPLGIAILVLVVVRFVNRLLSRVPPFPATMSRAE